MLLHLQPLRLCVTSFCFRCKHRKNKKESFSRRRVYRENKDIDFINDRNAHFNKKIERAFGQYTQVRLSLSSPPPVCMCVWVRILQQEDRARVLAVPTGARW